MDSLKSLKILIYFVKFIIMANLRKKRRKFISNKLNLKNIIFP